MCGSFPAKQPIAQREPARLPGPVWRNVMGMCRSIKTLRQPYAEQVTEADVRAAALQYVKKISGFQKPASHNAEAFEQAVAAVAQATQDLLDHLEIRGQRTAQAAGA